MRALYDTIFKRKSMRKFDETMCLSDEELTEIEQELKKLTPLVKDIRVKFEIVKRTDTTAKRGEYCLLMYSEKKSHYLINAGYLLEQMDLFLSSRDVGVCWYALAKPKQIQIEGLDHVIMLAFGKSSKKDFRNDVSQFKRKSLEEIWKDDFDPFVKEATRLSPSACNTQPWRIINDNICIKLYRNTKIKSFIPASKLPYYNSIDMGICLCFLEIALMHQGYEFDRLLISEKESDLELVEVATYYMNKTC